MAYKRMYSACSTSTTFKTGTFQSVNDCEYVCCGPRARGHRPRIPALPRLPRPSPVQSYKTYKKISVLRPSYGRPAMSIFISIPSAARRAANQHTASQCLLPNIPPNVVHVARLFVSIMSIEKPALRPFDLRRINFEHLSL